MKATLSKYETLCPVYQPQIAVKGQIIKAAFKVIAL